MAGQPEAWVPTSDQGTSLLARFDLPSGALPLLRSIADYGEITAEELAQAAASETRDTDQDAEVLELLVRFAGDSGGSALGRGSATCVV